MKAEEVGIWSEGLFFMEEYGISQTDAAALAIFFFQCGLGAAVYRRPARVVRLPAGAPELDENQLALIAEPAPKPKREPKKALHRIPEDLKLEPEMAKFALDRAFTQVELGTMWTKFFNHYAANGETAVDWKAKWRTWVMRGVEYKERNARPTGGNTDGRL